ncbi:potassium transporter TrkA [Natronomonas sp. EA1]|uniref:potassium transporter TrkA n=1 Tax=Natronomonas sp. EA1 TaxID=3421655 RepID=UPI003EBD430F
MIPVVAQVNLLLGAAVKVVAYGLVSAVAGVVTAFLHRWYARSRVPDGLPVLIGLSVIAVLLNTTTALSTFQGTVGGRDPLAIETVLTNVVTFLVAGLTAVAGARAGDRLGNSISAVTGAKRLEGDVSKLVESVGRVITVKLPDEIGDMDGHDPVDATVKEKLAGATLVFPRRLTVEELRTRLVERLKTDYNVGYVDIDLNEDATVDYLAVGSREAGIGPTLPPGSAAVSVRADPAFAASAGDLVQVWTADGATRVANAEVRGVAGDIVTIAVDEDEAKTFDPTARYRLVTLPVTPRADREFASLLRAAEETMGAVTIEAGSDLVATTVGGLDIAVVAVRGETGIEPIPPRGRALTAGETVYAIARPDALRRLEAAASTDND